MMIGLFLKAFQLAGLAQRVGAEPVDRVAQRMMDLPRPPRRLPPRAAALAARRACRWRSRLTAGMDSCLIRTLVTGVLLADHPDVVLHVGFRQAAGTGALHDGHAWLTVEGRDLPEASMVPQPGEPFTEVRAIPLTRERGEGT